MSLKITTPNAQQESGDARLKKYVFSGKNGRKFFTVHNDGPNVIDVNFWLTDIDGSGGYTLFPGGATSDQSVFVHMTVGSEFAFSVDYDSTLGDSSGVTLSCDNNIHTLDQSGATTSNLLIGPGLDITFTSEINTVNTKRSLGTLLCQDADGNYQIVDSTRKITEDETSFGLIRTNPKLTGNLKLTVDSSSEIWLNSIDAVKELADDKYKKYRIGKNSSYATDINKFFDLGNTPPEIVFSLYQADTQYTSSKRNLSEQYDRFYHYGVSELKSKFYDEDFAFFAPLYLKTEIPDYFVIFRTNGPVNKFSYDNSDMNTWKDGVTSEILANSQIIKTFSLAETTPIGQYLRNIVNHSARTETDITVSYQANGYTYFNGIAYNKGSFAQMGELLYDYYNEENPLMTTEEFITGGFERNKVISSHIINLEFLFDDLQAEQYSINRYFGLYVNAIDLATFSINEDALQVFSPQINQKPFPRKGIDGSKISRKSFTQTNTDGISVFVDNDSIERTTPVNQDKMFTSTIEYILSPLSVGLKGNYVPRLAVGDLLKFYSSTNLVAQANIQSIAYNDDVTEITLDLSSYYSQINLTVSNLQSIYTQLTCDFYTEEKYKTYIDSIFNSSIIDTSRFFYVRDNKNTIHSVSGTQERFYNAELSTVSKAIEIKLKDLSYDISSLGGFSNLLTQATAEVINSKGRSSLSVEILDYFDPGDYIEISWTPNAVIPGYPTRWRAIANDGYLNPGEALPATSLASDSEGEYYFAYFHSGDNTIHLDTFVSSISRAFNNFPFKNFEVVAIGTSLHFRSTQEGVNSNHAKMQFSLSNAHIDIMGTDATSSGEVHFMGGSDKKRTRCKISDETAKGMLIDEYISTKGSFSIARSYDVLQNKIVFSPYTEEPVYNTSGELIGFNGINDYKIVTIENEDYDVQLTSDSKMTTYELFKPSFGILSVMPLRDFDMDFFYSEYTKSYTPELIEYFGRYAAPATVGATAPNYVFDNNYSFETYPASVPFLVISQDGSKPPVLHNNDMQFVFSSSGNTATLVGSSLPPSIGDIVLFMPNEKSLYFSDPELSKFKGFLSLSGIVSSRDEEIFKSLENQWDPTRFTFQSINSEYERLEENFLKTLVLKSRVVPYITKWVSPQGKDIRDNQYRFNYHRSFGNTNFSPSAEMYIPDPRYHTHEWPYLSAVPDKFPIATFPDHAFSYMFEGMTDKYDFSSLKRDWFSNYFTVGYPCELYNDGTEYVKAVIDPTEKYSFFNYQAYNDTTETLFRGYKFTINEIDSKSNVVSLSTKYDNYKFSSIIETIEDDMFSNEDPITYTTIVNEKWKFILLKITVRNSTYRFCEGNIGYTDLYTLYSKNEKTFFENITGLEYEVAIPSDRKIPRINFKTSFPISPANSFTLLPSGATYLQNLQEEVTLLETGVYSSLIGAYVKPSFKLSIDFPVVDKVNNEKSLSLKGNTVSSKRSSLGYLLNATIPNTGIANWNEVLLYHQSGGNASLVGMKERLSFAEIVKVMEGKSSKSKMNYQIYFEDSTSYTGTTPNFVIKAISPESITRIYDYYPIDDSDKPKEFYTVKQIGAVLAQQKDLQTIYRYQGNFSPKFRDVLKFWVREDDHFTDIVSRDFLLNNTHIGTNLADFSIMKNQYFSKVSDSEVLRLSPESGYQPVYPLSLIHI
jgi:hypothetical protein